MVKIQSIARVQLIVSLLRIYIAQRVPRTKKYFLWRDVSFFFFSLKNYPFYCVGFLLDIKD